MTVSLALCNACWSSLESDVHRFIDEERCTRSRSFGDTDAVFKRRYDDLQRCSSTDASEER